MILQMVTTLSTSISLIWKSTHRLQLVLSYLTPTTMTTLKILAIEFKIPRPSPLTLLTNNVSSNRQATCTRTDLSTLLLVNPLTMSLTETLSLSTPHLFKPPPNLKLMRPHKICLHVPLTSTSTTLLSSSSTCSL
jgi:hypothetical protein